MSKHQVGAEAYLDLYIVCFIGFQRLVPPSLEKTKRHYRSFKLLQVQGPYAIVLGLQPNHLGPCVLRDCARLQIRSFYKPYLSHQNQPRKNPTMTLNGMHFF